MKAIRHPICHLKNCSILTIEPVDINYSQVWKKEARVMETDERNEVKEGEHEGVTYPQTQTEMDRDTEQEDGHRNWSDNNELSVDQ